MSTAAMPAPTERVFLFDFDNTLFDNDGLQDALNAEIERLFDVATRERYWIEIRALEKTLGYVDYLGAIQRCRQADEGDPRWAQLSAYMLDQDFPRRLLPQALAVLAHLGRFGTTVMLSDGDIVFQPLKLRRSGVTAAVDGRVLIYIHKQQRLDDLQRRFPARHYIMIDDKLRILTAMKSALGERLTTVFPRQGHYARDPAILAECPPADLSVDRIGDLLDFGPDRFAPASADRGTAAG